MTCLEKASEATSVGAKSPGLKQMEKEVLEEHKRHENLDEGEETRRTGSEQAEGLSEGWEIIEKEEVIDAMASFIAAYIQVKTKVMTTTLFFAWSLMRMHPLSRSSFFLSFRPTRKPPS